MFVGFVDLEGTLVGTLLVTDGSGTPVDADALPVFRVYGPNGYVEADSTSLKDTASITGATNANPIVIESEDHGLTDGTYVTIAGVGGNDNANGNFVVTRVDADHFSIPVAGSGDYTSGGTWNVTGLYNFSIDVTGVSGYEKGEVYQVLFTYAVSSTQQGQLHAFNVS